VAQTDGGRNALVTVPTFRATLLLFLGHYDQAREQIALGLAEARRLGRPHLLLASALGTAAWHHVLLDEDAPRHLLDALGELVAEQGFPYWRMEALLHRGLALARAGETREGVALVCKGAARYDALDAAWHAPVAFCLAAGLTKGVEGLALVDEASARFERTGVRFFDAEVRRIRGALLAEGGDAAGAEAQFLEAIGIARDQGAKHWELRAATGLARLRRDQGRRAEARDLLALVYGWFTEGFDLPDLRNARALLDALA
jgi:predicted ATPase